MAKIKDVKFELRNYVYEKPFHIVNSIASETTNLEIKLTLENGTVGYGEAASSFRVNGEKIEMLASLQNYVKDILIGQDVKEYGKVFDMTDKLFAVPSLKAAIQYSVLDALSQEIEVPVCNILSGRLKEIEIDKTVGLDTVQNRIDDAMNIFNQGFRRLKIKVGENLKEDLEVMSEINRLTNDVRYIVDANMGYTPKQAVQFAQQLYKNGIDIDIFEQPVTRYDLEGLKFVRFNSPFPVAADESARTKFDVMRLIKEEAVDYINIKLMKSGISDALSIVEITKSANLKLMIGCMSESSVGINQSVHFALGTGAFDYYDLDSHLMLKENEFRGKFLQDGPKIYVK